MEYLIKASAIIALFYGFYKLVLQKETFFQSNRWFLFIGLLSTILIPLIVIPIYTEAKITTFQSFNYTTILESEQQVEEIDWSQIISYIYIGGVLIFGMKFILNLLSLSSLLLSHSKKKRDSFYFIKTEKEISPFSFFNFIVFNKNQFNKKELKQIILHEKVHAQQLHTLDILASQIVTIIFWFNPFVWLYKKELQQNLEFIADDIAQKKSESEKSYQQLLLKTSITNSKLVLTNNFYTSLIKKRIIMLHKNRSKTSNRWKITLILPLLALFIMSFNTEEITITNNKSTIENNTKGKLKKIIDFIITKNSTKEDLDNIKKEALKYDVSIKIKKIKRNNDTEITGVKIEVNSNKSSSNYSTSSNNAIRAIKISFDNKGNKISIGNIDAVNPKNEINSSISKIIIEGIKFDNEDDVIKTEDIGKIDIKQIIVFKNQNSINEYDEKVKNGVAKIVTKIDVEDVTFIPDSENEPIFIIDDEVVTKKQLNLLDHNYIQKMNILKDKNAIKKYGKKARNGAVEVYTKKLVVSDNKENPLYIIDDEEAKKEHLELLNPDNIEKMNVLKGKKATEKYGDKGKNGVIEIITKK